MMIIVVALGTADRVDRALADPVYLRPRGRVNINK